MEQTTYDERKLFSKDMLETNNFTAYTVSSHDDKPKYN